MGGWCGSSHRTRRKRARNQAGGREHPHPPRAAGNSRQGEVRGVDKSLLMGGTLSAWVEPFLGAIISPGSSAGTTQSRGARSPEIRSASTSETTGSRNLRSAGLTGQAAQAACCLRMRKFPRRPGDAARTGGDPRSTPRQAEPDQEVGGSDVPTVRLVSNRLVVSAELRRVYGQ